MTLIKVENLIRYSKVPLRPLDVAKALEEKPLAVLRILNELAVSGVITRAESTTIGGVPFFIFKRLKGKDDDSDGPSP